MNKIYLKPESTVFELKAEHMIATSIGVDNSHSPVDGSQSLSNDREYFDTEDMWK